MNALDSHIVQDMLRTAPIGMVVFDNHNNITSINDFGAALLEYNSEDLVGTNLDHHIVNGAGLFQQKFTDADHIRVHAYTESMRYIDLSFKVKRLSRKLSYAIFHNPIEYAIGDTLTKALNREQFFDALSKMDENYSLLFIDLNKFKAVNDTLGHNAGDMVLQTVAKRITGCLRDTDLLCRYGGDEFVVVVPGMKINGEVVRKKIEKLVEEPMHFRNENVQISCSVGVAHKAEAKNTEELIQIADKRMYKEKG